jgi:ABC-2 type transport system permease protein
MSDRANNYPMTSRSMMSRIVAKELTLFFASPVAYLFMAVFLALTLFVFFWVEAFFSRNIANVRPLFQWLPVVMIFLASALTMRMWSEERRTGTLEFVHTLPTGLTQFVLGKFFACLLLLIIALSLTLPIPLMVSIIAELDWGPVIAAYLATILLGAVYISVGLFVSARTDNQIVSLMISVLLCVLLYLPGTAIVNNLLDTGSAEFFRHLGTGSRFEAISRGVIDIRDLYYYFSLIVVFIGLNIFTLEKQRWAGAVKGDGKGQGSRKRHSQWSLLIALIIANALFANVWLNKVETLRFDATENRIYSLSKPTLNYLSQLQEPLIIRGYFTAKTHPLLSPLVPQIQDLIHEFEVYGDGKVKVEFIDPAADPALEEEANSKYGIRATPFQVSDRYQAGLVNSYFDLVVQYGDQFEVLSFRDLIEIRIEGEADLDVKLRNPEYDLTNAVRKVLYGFQSGGNLYATLAAPVKFTGYFSAEEKLPEQLLPLRKSIEEFIKTQTEKSQGKLSASWIDPQQPGETAALATLNAYGFKPMAASVTSDETFYFYMTLDQDGEGEDSGKIMQIPLPEDLKIETFVRNFNNAMQRFAKGFTRHITVVTPPVDPYAAQFGQGSRQFTKLTKYLQQNIDVKPNNLVSGKVPADTDVLLLLSPENFTEQQVFAVDQFLMQGGTVIVATSPFAARLDNNQLSVTAQASGLENWLNAMGVSMRPSLVMDARNTSFPIPVTRQVDGYSFQEVSMLDYPYFVDIRGDGMNRDVSLTASLNQLTMTWASPIDINLPAEQTVTATPLLHSSEKSWLSESLDVMPKVKQDGSSGFSPGPDQQKHLLAVALNGKFSSFFKNKPSPLAAARDEQNRNANSLSEAPVREISSSNARLVVLSSNEFLTDQTLGLAAAVTGSEYLPPLDLIVNTIEWSLDDSELSSIRSRSQFGNTLPPLPVGEQRIVEYLVYAVSLLLLSGVVIIQWFVHRRRMRRYQQWLFG